MRFLRVFGKLLCFIGALAALMGVLATAVPMIDNEKVQSIVASFSARGDSAFINSFNGVVQYCLDHNYFVFIAGMAVLLIGGGMKSLAEKALFRSIFMRAPAPTPEESKPETPAEGEPTRAHAPRATVTAPTDARSSYTTPKTTEIPVAEPTEAWPSYTAPKMDGISANEPEQAWPSYTAPKMEEISADVPEDIRPSHAHPGTEAKSAEIPEPHSLLFPDVKPSVKEVEEIIYGAANRESREIAEDVTKMEPAAVPVGDALFAPEAENQPLSAASEAAATPPVVYTPRYTPVYTEPVPYALQPEPQDDVAAAAVVAPMVDVPEEPVRIDSVLPRVVPTMDEWQVDAVENKPASVPEPSEIRETEPGTVREAAVEAIRQLQTREEQPIPVTPLSAMQTAEPVAETAVTKARAVHTTPIQPPVAQPVRVPVVQTTLVMQPPMPPAAPAPVAYTAYTDHPAPAPAAQRAQPLAPQAIQPPATQPVRIPVVQTAPVMQLPMIPPAASAPTAYTAYTERLAPTPIAQRAQPLAPQAIQPPTTQPVRMPVVQTAPIMQPPMMPIVTPAPATYAAYTERPAPAPVTQRAQPLAPQTIQPPATNPVRVPVVQTAPIMQPPMMPPAASAPTAYAARVDRPAPAPIAQRAQPLAPQAIQPPATQPVRVPVVQTAPVMQLPVRPVSTPTPTQAASILPPRTQVPVTQPTYAPLVQPMQTRAAQPAPVNPPPAVSNTAPVAYIRREDRPVAGQATLLQQPVAQIPAPRLPQKPVPRPAQPSIEQIVPAPAVQPVPVRPQPAAPGTAPNTMYYTTPNAAPVASVRREDLPVPGQAATVRQPAAQPQAAQITPTPAIQPAPVRPQPAAPVTMPNAVPQPAAQSPVTPAYRGAGVQAEWQTRTSANDRVIVATRQPVQTRVVQPSPTIPASSAPISHTPPTPPVANVPYTLPAAPVANAPYTATAPVANRAPTSAVWVGTYPAPPIPQHFHTPAMQGSASNTLRTPPPPIATHSPAQPDPPQPQPAQPQPGQVRIVSTFRGYAVDGQGAPTQAEAPTAGYSQYTPFTPPHVNGQPATQPRIVSTLGQRGERQP